MTTDDTRDRLAAALDRIGYGILNEQGATDALLACLTAHGLRLSLADAPDEGLRAIEQAVQSKAIRVEYRGSTAYVRLANVYAALAAEEAERG